VSQCIQWRRQRIELQFKSLEVQIEESSAPSGNSSKLSTTLVKVLFDTVSDAHMIQMGTGCLVEFSL